MLSSTARLWDTDPSTHRTGEPLKVLRSILDRIPHDGSPGVPADGPSSFVRRSETATNYPPEVIVQLSLTGVGATQAKVVRYGGKRYEFEEGARRGLVRSRWDRNRLWINPTVRWAYSLFHPQSPAARRTGCRTLPRPGSRGRDHWIGNDALVDERHADDLRDCDRSV